MNAKRKGTAREYQSKRLLEALAAFSVPANCRVIIHRWRDRAKLPEVVELSPQG
jgi:hypothetical protein